MDSALVSVTLLSMAMAGVLSAVVWRMLRIERRRSDARVMALADMAAQIDGGARRAITPPPVTPPPVTPSHAARPPAPAAPDLTLRDAPAGKSAMFAEPQHASPWGTRAAVMSGIALTLAAIVLFALSAQERATVRASAATKPVAAPAASPALELLSLHDSRQPGSLTITGLVQNPRGGPMLTRVTVTAFAFDENGGFLASGRALLDVTALAPGDESPFVVTVPVTETVARYRIGFRGDDGRVIAHTDRRQQGSVATVDARATAGI